MSFAVIAVTHCTSGGDTCIGRINHQQSSRNEKSDDNGGSIHARLHTFNDVSRVREVFIAVYKSTTNYIRQPRHHAERALR
jgi:hypothetical protein